MSGVRRRCGFSLLAVTIAACAPISAHSQQPIPGIFGVVGGIINSAIVDSARREWLNRPFADYNCLASRNLSADQLAAIGIGPNDPRIRRLLNECSPARRWPERTEQQAVTALAVGPHNPNFVVDGFALGGTVYPDSAVYKAYTCRPSDDFAGFTWCAEHHTEKSKFGPYTSWVTILHSSANKVAFVTQAIIPAFFEPGDVDREIQRLSRGFGQAKILYADPRRGVPHAVLAAWGAITLTPLDEAAMETLRHGEEIHLGLVADFIGDKDKSARIGLPVFSIGGGPGYLWGANFDEAGKGSLQISAVDASALTPILNAPTAKVAPSGPTKESSEASTDTSKPSLSTGECSKIADPTQRLACYDRLNTSPETIVPPVVPNVSSESAPTKDSAEQPTSGPPQQQKTYTNSIVPIESDAILYKDSKDDIELINQLVELVKSNDYMCNSISAARPTIFSRGFELTCDEFKHSYYIQDKGGHWTVTVE